jgi:putative transposase
MKRSRHGIEQIIRVLAEVEGSIAKISDGFRLYNITDQAYYHWKRKYGGIAPGDARRLKFDTVHRQGHDQQEKYHHRNGG